MSKYKIPEVFHTGFQLLSQLNSTQINTITNDLDNLKVGQSPSDIVESLQLYLELDIKEINDIVQTLFSIVNLYEDSESTKENLSQDLAMSFKNSEMIIEDNVVNQLNSNLLTILSHSQNVRLTLKANALLGEYDKIFIKNRIVTDIRMVYNDSLTDSVQSAVIIHQLKVGYQNNGKLKEAFYAMDSNDLKTLKLSIERALEKEQNIRSGLYAKSLNFIDFPSQK